MLRAGVCINCAEKTAALIIESSPGEVAVEPCSGACRGDRAVLLHAARALARAAHTTVGCDNPWRTQCAVPRAAHWRGRTARGRWSSGQGLETARAALPWSWIGQGIAGGLPKTS